PDDTPIEPAPFTPGTPIDEAYAQREAERLAQEQAQRDRDYAAALQQKHEQELENEQVLWNLSQEGAPPPGAAMRAAFEKAQQQAAAAPVTTPLMSGSGKPFRTEQSARLSKTFRTTPGAT